LYFYFILFLRESQLSEGDRWLAETRHVTTVGRPAVSCPLKSSARGRPQHQTLVSVPPSQFWYIDADERQRKKNENRKLESSYFVWIIIQRRAVVNFLLFQHVVEEHCGHSSSSLIFFPRVHLLTVSHQSTRHLSKFGKSIYYLFVSSKSSVNNISHST
jgi:hypothetical protein